MNSQAESHTLGPSLALGGERRGNGFEKRMPFNANFHFSHTICEITKSHEHVGRFALMSILSSTIPIVYIQKHTHCDRLQRKNHTHEETGREGWEVFGEAGHTTKTT